MSRVLLYRHPSGNEQLNAYAEVIAGQVFISQPDGPGRESAIVVPLEDFGKFTDECEAFYTRGPEVPA